MNKNINLPKMITGIVLMQLGVLFLSMFTGIENWINTKTLIILIGSMILYPIYIGIIIIINIRKLEKGNLKKRSIGFIKSFLGLSLLNYICNYFKISNSSLLSLISTAFGVSFGIYFMDIAWLKKKEKYSLDYIYKKNNIT
ncbi:hypothetical protein [Tepidibacter mesophilus]|uniref:hypothetical protein n=1 Tax=Tepidibacter mesophilus TaxID=655607 RepID=UPI000C08D263|nr:hypothetical protein [Tepidibacter mesophilus]